LAALGLSLTLQRTSSKLERVLRAIPDNQMGRFERQSRRTGDANRWKLQAVSGGLAIRKPESGERGSGGLDLGLNPLALRSMLSCMGL
jgi:hypothetical protein